MHGLPLLALLGPSVWPHNFIDNLPSQKAQFIASWEAELLKSFFSNVRNPLGHGPGEGDSISLTDNQTNWVIEFCMSWIKSLIRRMQGAGPINLSVGTSAFE